MIINTGHASTYYPPKEVVMPDGSVVKTKGFRVIRGEELLDVPTFERRNIVLNEQDRENIRMLNNIQLRLLEQEYPDYDEPVPPCVFKKFD